MQIHHIWERGGQTNGRFLACRGINIGLEEKGGLSPPFPRPPSFILRLLIHHRSFLEVVSLSLPLSSGCRRHHLEKGLPKEEETVTTKFIFWNNMGNGKDGDSLFGFLKKEEGNPFQAAEAGKGAWDPLFGTHSNPPKKANSPPPSPPREKWSMEGNKKGSKGGRTLLFPLPSAPSDVTSFASASTPPPPPPPQMVQIPGEIPSTPVRPRRLIFSQDQA